MRRSWRSWVWTSKTAIRRRHPRHRAIHSRCGQVVGTGLVRSRGCVRGEPAPATRLAARRTVWNRAPCQQSYDAVGTPVLRPIVTTTAVSRPVAGSHKPCTDVGIGAEPVTGFDAVDDSCGLEVDSHEGDFLTLNESQHNGTRTESLHCNLKK